MFQIQIPNPCHEDWDKMSPTQKGAFCKVCSKEVFDFTSSSPSEVKNTLIKEKSPCVRILQSQMDEMNFFEWFRSLVIKQKVKYIFLFAFIIAAQNIAAQNQIQPQEVSIDSADINSLDQAAIEEASEEDENSSLSCESTELAVAAGSIYVPEDLSSRIYYPVGGAITSIDIISLGGIAIPHHETSYEINFENQIVIADEIYSFTTEGDSLYFRSVLPEAGQIFLSIEQDRLGKTPYPPYNEVFESPIELDAGEQLITLAIGKYVNGSYTIKIKSKKGEGVGRIMYW